MSDEGGRSLYLSCILPIHLNGSYSQILNIKYYTWFSFSHSIRIEQLYQNVLALWHHSHINMKSVVSWHYLMTDIRAIRKSTVASVQIFCLRVP